MATVTIKFDIDNAAFEDNWIGEIGYVMTRATQILEDAGVNAFERKLRDSNGNTIGAVEVTA